MHYPSDPFTTLAVSSSAAADYQPLAVHGPLHGRKYVESASCDFALLNQPLAVFSWPGGRSFKVPSRGRPTFSAAAVGGIIKTRTQQQLSLIHI